MTTAAASRPGSSAVAAMKMSRRSVDASRSWPLALQADAPDCCACSCASNSHSQGRAMMTVPHSSIHCIWSKSTSCGGQAVEPQDARVSSICPPGSRKNEKSSAAMGHTVVVRSTRP